MICDNLIHVTGGAIPFSRRTLLTSESLIQLQTAFARNGRDEDCDQVRDTRLAEQRESQQGVASVWRRGVGRQREVVTVLLYLVITRSVVGDVPRELNKDRWPEYRCAGGAALRLIDTGLTAMNSPKRSQEAASCLLHFCPDA